MSKVYDFLNECGTYYLSTINDGAPATRPFGAVIEYEGTLYFSTANTKSVYEQLKENSNIQIVALRPQSREWIRINGKAVETQEILIKQAMLDAYEVLQARFQVDSSNYALFGITEMSAVLMGQSGETPIV